MTESTAPLVPDGTDDDEARRGYAERTVDAWRKYAAHWRTRAEKAEAANVRTGERLNELIAAGFGAVGDTLRELRRILDGDQEAASRRALWAPVPVPRWAVEALTGPSEIQEKAQAERALKAALAALNDQETEHG